jgi:hypothetical protein
MSRFIDLKGQRFGRLTVVCRDDLIKKDGKKETAFICKCDCGKVRKVLAYNLKNGHTQSCGCQSLENRVKAQTKHKMTGTRIYRIWRGMKTRCENPNDYHYKFYGERGIKVCEEWQNFEPFYEWALVSGYSDSLTIDRINNSGDYEPVNCRWATMKEQSNNTRKNRIITHNGISHTLSEWADISNMKPGTLAHRIDSGWGMEEALNTPVRRYINGHYITSLSAGPF